MGTEKQTWIAEFYEKHTISADPDKAYEKTKRASDFLCRKFKTYVESLNNHYGHEAINVIDPPPGFMGAVFGTEAEKPGFLLLFGNSKLVMALCGGNSTVTFVGRKIDPDPQKPKKNLKLLGVIWEERGNGRYIFRDSTGVEIEIRELILRIIRWGAG